MISRRVFMKNGGLALVSLGFTPAFLARAAEAAGARRKILVAIFQRGAVDGLNMIVPYGERAYYAARPSIAIPRPGAAADAAVDLDGFFGLHPRMAPLKPLFDRRELAIVHATGSPDSTRSHFDAQDYMESATPGVKSTRDGWLNRCLHAREHRSATPFRAVALAPQLPRALQGTAQALAIGRLNQFGIRDRAMDGGVASSFESEYAAAADRVLKETGSEAFEAIRMLRNADPSRYRPANGAQYPRSAYGEALRQIAQLVKADVGLEIAFTETGNWDHHVNEGASTGQLALRLDDFARGIAAFTADLAERMADVLVLTMSEFGRAVAENGNGGTDHGHGNAMMAIGAGVRGGRIYGEWPGLESSQRFEGRDLAVTTDFRDVFAEVAVRHLAITDASPVFPGFRVDRARFRGFLTA
ncbi:MAG: DUF1501 domain-containing protein [Vicinamibacterales bacterium]